jgi:maltose/moltooligosaccharide transporter
VIKLGCQNLAVDETLFFIGLFYVVSLYFFLSVVRYGWQQVCWVLDAEIILLWNLIEHLLQTLKPAQQPTGFQAQSSSLVWANFGKCFTIPFPLVLLVQREITNLGFASFFLGAVCSIGSVWWSSLLPKKYRLLKKN